MWDQKTGNSNRDRKEKQIPLRGMTERKARATAKAMVVGFG